MPQAKTTTVGQLLVEQALPAELRHLVRGRTLDAKGVRAVLQTVADTRPDLYRPISKRLVDVGKEVATATGGFSFGLQHMLESPAAARVRGEIEAGLRRIRSDRSLDRKARNRAIVELLASKQKALEKAIFEEGLAEKNPLALQVLSGGRGKPMNLKSLRGGDLMYEDHRGNPLPIPITSPYSRGLTPAEYWAGAFGARAGVYATKKATADAGYYGKRLAQAVHDLVVTGADYEDEDQDETRLHWGLPVDVEDPDNDGALLARETGGYPRNTVLTPKVLRDLKARGHGRILVRSPLVGGPPEGGVYARDVGVRERGGLAPRGDFVGLAAAQSVAEKLSQSMLCLDEETEVRMADGSVRAIRDVRPGDEVVGSTRWGTAERVRVLAVHDNGGRECVRCAFEAWDRIRCTWGPCAELVCTPDHKVLRDCNDREDWQATGSAFAPVPVGEWPDESYAIWMDPLQDPLRPPTAETARWEANDCVRLASCTPVGPRRTMDLTINHPDHLFVLANGLVVSNSSKHAGGVAGATQAVGGYEYLNAQIEAQKSFKGAAPHAQLDGVVQGVRAAPQGGHYVTISGKEHYVPSGQTPAVKPGDTVDAGDTLSNGIPQPAEIVRFKGLGEGRRHFVKAFLEGLKASGISAHRRNIELIASGLLRHVRMTDELGDYSPDDLVPYAALARSWEPREGSETVSTSSAVGKYLERPVLHHTIGTKIRRSMLPELEEFGIRNLVVHRDPPPFEPEFVRASAALQHYPDWMTRHLGSNLEKATLDAAHRGVESDELGVSLVPGLAKRVDFGRIGLTKAWKPEEIERLPRDGDGDGSIYDGTSRERSDPRRAR